MLLTMLVMAACSQEPTEVHQQAEQVEPVDYEQLTVAELRNLAEQGDLGAQIDLGYRYDTGLGAPQDSEEAVRWYLLAAEQGDATAQFNLGLSYSRGEGVPQDFAEAVRWWRAAAEQGHAGAQFQLGFRYLMGQGVPEDYVQAHKWLNLSTVNEADRERAVTLRDGLAEKMTPEQVAEAQRLTRQFKPKTWAVIRKELKIE